MKKRLVKFKVEKTNTGFSAYSKKYSIVAVGKTLKKLLKDAKSGLSLQCDYMNEKLKKYKMVFDLDKAF